MQCGGTRVATRRNFGIGKTAKVKLEFEEMEFSDIGGLMVSRL